MALKLDVSSYTDNYVSENCTESYEIVTKRVPGPYPQIHFRQTSGEANEFAVTFGGDELSEFIVLLKELEAQF